VKHVFQVEAIADQAVAFSSDDPAQSASGIQHGCCIRAVPVVHGNGFHAENAEKHV
jgi:hypothetical protein